MNIKETFESVDSKLDEIGDRIYVIGSHLVEPVAPIDFLLIEKNVELIFKLSPCIAHGVFHFLVDEMDLRDNFSLKFLD